MPTLACGIEEKTNINALGDVAHGRSAGVLTGAFGGDEDTAAPANVTRLCAFVLVCIKDFTWIDGFLQITS